MKSDQFNGRVWCFGNDVDTDVIIPARYLALPEPEDWAEHVMEPEAPNFSAQLTGNDIIVAGDNFGYGSSREHAAIALKVAGVCAIVARSFSVIFYRNAINNGLPLIECASAVDDAVEGDQIVIDLRVGRLRNVTQAKEYEFEPLPEFLLEMVRAGGLVPHYQAQN